MTDAPRLEACYFGNTEPRLDAIYRKLAHVLNYTARKHCPEWVVNVEKLTPPPYTSGMGNHSHVWNTQKLEFWRRQTETAPDGARLLLIDGDMLIQKPLDDIWSHDFDLAYTIRNGGTRLPLNGGVVFLRVSDATRAFMQAWWDVNIRFLRRPLEHRNWRLKYAGINQASFGYMLEKGHPVKKVEKLLCSEWNLCEWERHDPNGARIIHVKSTLRRALFKFFPVPRGGTNVVRIIKIWLEAEQEMMKWQRRQAETSASTATAPTPSTSAVA